MVSFTYLPTKSVIAIERQKGVVQSGKPNNILPPIPFTKDHEIGE